MARRRALSLRWRISLLVAAVACTVAAGIGVSVHQVTKTRMLDEARGDTMERAEFVSRTQSGTGDPLFGVMLDPPNAPETLRKEVRKGRKVSVEASGLVGPVMWSGVPMGEHVLAARISLRDEYAALHELDVTMAGAAGLAVAVTVPLGTLIAGRMSRRLREASATARRIADGDLDARIGGTPRPGDEIAELSAAVDSMARALQDRLHGEQRFTADVAHELRTPLMGLATSADLLCGEEVAVGYVRDRVRVLSGLVENLLEISRLDGGAERADLFPCPLSPLVADCVRRAEVAVELRVDGAGLVHTDPRRVDRILSNLVVNADRHGKGPVVVTVAAASVSVRDHGPGYPDSLLDAGPQRFRTGTPERGRGHGLGLTIAAGQAEVIGANLTFANAPDGGALATLTLPTAADDAT
ncbi:ATP-binding protein [Streptomyces sp. NPDC012746]|uniref:ATP-binding protein n=1 Tax=Streptomyces sp. NPDC012746 TaxID=3364845 RepID=UPI0036A73CF2